METLEFQQEYQEKRDIRKKPQDAIKAVLEDRQSRLLAEEVLEDILPVPFMTPESAGQDLVELLLTKVIAPYI